MHRLSVPVVPPKARPAQSAARWGARQRRQHASGGADLPTPATAACAAWCPSRCSPPATGARPRASGSQVGLEARQESPTPHCSRSWGDSSRCGPQHRASPLSSVPLARSRTRLPRWRPGRDLQLRPRTCSSSEAPSRGNSRECPGRRYLSAACHTACTGSCLVKLGAGLVCQRKALYEH